MKDVGSWAGPPNQSKELAALAEEAVRVFQEEQPEAYQELIKAFEGKSANLALLGRGKFHVAVQRGQVRVEPNVARTGPGTAHGAIGPETLLALVEGRLTPLEAYFKGDLIARTGSPDLHLAYDYFVRFADLALRSKRLQGLLEKFRQTFRV